MPDSPPPVSPLTLRLALGPMCDAVKSAWLDGDEKTALLRLDHGVRTLQEVAWRVRSGELTPSASLAAEAPAAPRATGPSSLTVDPTAPIPSWVPRGWVYVASLDKHGTAWERASRLDTDVEQLVYRPCDGSWTVTVVRRERTSGREVRVPDVAPTELGVRRALARAARALEYLSAPLLDEIAFFPDDVLPPRPL